MGYPASSGTSLINVLHMAYLRAFPPVIGGGMTTVNLARLSFSAHSCTSDHGMSSFSASSPLMAGTVVAADEDEVDEKSSLPAALLLADAVIFTDNTLFGQSLVDDGVNDIFCCGAPS